MLNFLEKKIKNLVINYLIVTVHIRNFLELYV
jgi:hypothetical protein